jgi:Tfp pilus assembly protein PilO
MPNKKKKVPPIKINLLASKNFNKSTLGKIINWSLTIGKLIVFITFAMVIFALFYRFSLDKKTEILSDKINKNLSVIQTYSEVEPKIRQAQEKIAYIKELTQDDTSLLTVFQQVEANLSPTCQIEAFSINLDLKTVTLRGSTPNEVIFSQMLNSFKKEEEFSEISIDELISGGAADPQILFVINIKLS